MKIQHKKKMLKNLLDLNFQLSTSKKLSKQSKKNCISRKKHKNQKESNFKMRMQNYKNNKRIKKKMKKMILKINQ